MMALRDDGAGRTYRFGAYHLVPDRKLLLRGGEPVELGSRAMDILAALVERPGEVVSQRALVDRVWSRTVVDIGSVKVQVAALRKALGPYAPGQPYVETLPGRGYRLAVPVEVDEVPAAHAAAPRAVVVPATDDRSVEAERVHRFGDFQFIPGRHMLLHGLEPVRVGARALDLLQLLVERAGQLVTKDELIRFAWPRAYVHEANLKVNIAGLRRALSPGPSSLPAIVNVPGRGYRFVWPVRSELLRVTSQAASTLPETGDVIGREDVVGELLQHLETSRFVTITGPAGVGKTTVAVAVAERLRHRFPGGACFVDLAAIQDAQLVTSAIATALGVSASMSNLVLGITEALRGKRVLLLLDNCEHVRSAVATVADPLHASASGVTLLSTSREPLRSAGELVYRLRPLPLEGASVQLFLHRAHEACGFVATDASVAAIVEICRRLDGLPLAIELAATQLATFSPRELLARLEDSLDTVASDDSEAPLRQKTLGATLDWSYRLLSPDEARILRRTSVFAGSFTIDDLVGSCADLPYPPEVLASLVESLVAKSLVTNRWRPGGMTYRLLDTLRRYAASQLRIAGEECDAFEAHARYMLGIFTRAESEWQWRPREEWTQAYAKRVDDLRKAIDWGFGDGGVALLGVRLTAAAIPLWDELSSVGESRRRIDTALAHRAAIPVDEQLLAMKLVAARAWGLLYAEKLRPEGEDAWWDAYRLARETGSVDYQLRALWGLAVFQSFTGRHREALGTLDRFRALADTEGEQASLPDGERLRCTTSFYCGELAVARAGLERLVRATTDDRASRLARFQIDRSVGIHVSLAVLTWVTGEHALAGEHVRQALDRAEAMGHVVSQANALAQAGLPVAVWNSHWDTAERYVESLTESLNRRGLGVWGPVSRFYRGCILCARGDDGGVEVMHAAIGELLANRFLVRVPMYCAMLADAAIRHGHIDVAREALAIAETHVLSQDERWCEAEILRVRGLLCAHDREYTLAEALFTEAIERATATGTTSFALRAAMSLAAMRAQPAWQDDGVNRR